MSSTPPRTAARQPRPGEWNRRSNDTYNNTAAIREWAAANGQHVSERGRVPHAVNEAYDDAH